MSSIWKSWASLMKVLCFPRTLVAATADIARRIVLSQFHKLEHGTLVIYEPNGTKHVFDGSTLTDAPSATTLPPERHGLQKSDLAVELHIHSPDAWIRILLTHDIGFAESYMLGEITCENLTSFFQLFVLNSAALTLGSGILSSLTSVVTAPLHRLSNTTDQSLLNAQSHYSLSSDMFAAFLDPTMTYSAPIWLPTTDPASANDTLQAAQARKLHHIIAEARIKASDHILEIGTGWGSFAIEAVRATSCHVTTITLSSEQALLAQERIRDAGFHHEIEVLVCDYRHVPLPNDGKSRYDKIVSIEMIEHVGSGYLDTYFGCVDRYLKPDGGIAVFQVITIPEPRYLGYAARQDFIQRYIFPGGHLPTVSGLVGSIDRASKGRMVVDNVTSLGGHYARALREWRENFLANWEKVGPVLRKRKPAITDADLEIFKRKWEYYFSYCEAGFATKTLGDVSITVGREGAMELIEDIPM
ncbi:hypothetical protein MMC27_002820 [Xylographa pallens]|nr:hypothetical protein [Xylographa pallens]